MRRGEAYHLAPFSFARIPLACQVHIALAIPTTFAYISPESLQGSHLPTQCRRGRRGGVWHAKCILHLARHADLSHIPRPVGCLAQMLHIALPVPRGPRATREKRGPVAYIPLQRALGARLRCEARRADRAPWSQGEARRGKARRADRERCEARQARKTR